MRQSHLFTKTRKKAPSDEVSKNAKLLIQAGFVHKEMAGVYGYLPLGLKVRDKIEAIIRHEMNAVGGQEVKLTALQRPELWQETNRWSDEAMDVWFKTQLKEGGELGLAPTHEEPLTQALTQHINSYRDLPRAVYQFQTKFRNELRAKSGLMRGREFLMKDLYSFSKSQAEHDEFYADMKAAYRRIFDRIGIGGQTFYTYADGGSFSDFSHEFQTLSAAGEDTIYYNDDKQIAINKEVLTDDVLAEVGVTRDELTEGRAIEVGNIFPLGTKFSQPLGLTFTTEGGKEEPVIMGSYGIGVGRLMGTVVEVLSSENKLMWPEEIAPFRVHLLQLGSSKEAKKQAEDVYSELTGAGIEVLFDDRDASPGEKFADSDLIGLPTRVVVGNKTAGTGQVEVSQPGSDKDKMMTLTELRSNVVNH